MASKLSIISGAAVRLGGVPVISLTEDTKAAQSGDSLYDTILEGTLANHRWGFAKGKISLSLLADAPLNEWSYAYQLPTNPKLLSLVRVYPRMNYARYEDKIYCNSNQGIDIDYIYAPDASKFPPYFVELMEVRMAAAMAIPVTGSRTLRSEMLGEISGNNLEPGLWAKATGRDAQEYPQVPIEDSPYVQVRR